MALLFDNRGNGKLTLKSSNSGEYTLTFPTTTGKPGQFLQTDGNGNLTWASLPFNDGSQTSPGLAFNADTDTGFYRPEHNTIGVSAQGNEIARFTVNGLVITTGHITLLSDPQDNLHAATKQYVDTIHNSISNSLQQLDSKKPDTNVVSSTYLTQENARLTYLTNQDASSTYLTQQDASSIYLTQENAALTYLTQENAASTYAELLGRIEVLENLLKKS